MCRFLLIAAPVPSYKIDRLERLAAWLILGFSESSRRGSRVKSFVVISMNLGLMMMIAVWPEHKDSCKGSCYTLGAYHCCKECTSMDGL